MDVSRLRRIFTLIPWSMNRAILFLVIAAALSAVLDMAAVAAMLPLTEMLTAQGEVPGSVQKYVVPIVGTSNRQTLLLVLALFVGIAFLVKNLGLIAIRWRTIGITEKASSLVQAALLQRYIKAPYATHRTRSKATIIQAVMTAAPGALTTVLMGYISIVVDGLTVVLLLATMVVLSPASSLAAVVIFGGAALLVARVLKPAALRYAWRVMELETDSWRIINPAVEGFRESRIFRREKLFADAFRSNRVQMAAVRQPQLLLGEMPKYLLEIVMIFGILVVAFMLFLTQPETRAFALLAVFAAASLRIVPALNRLVATYNGVRGGRPYLELVTTELDVMDADDAADPVRDGDSVPLSEDADIVVENLGFHYADSEQMVLHDVDVVIPRGSTIALVGSSGAGKTTFADILAGLFHATAGSVTVAGLDIAEHPVAWRNQIAMVSQKVYLWEATVRDLITFGQPADEVDEQLLADVIRRARLDELIASMDHGLDTIVGEAGARVSGGQAQRIGIARALYAQPRVLILDEATSALDNETEYDITRTIEALHGEITVIVIAHRLSTVKNADEILFFADGTLRARGSMQELREGDLEFARLVELGSLE